MPTTLIGGPYFRGGGNNDSRTYGVSQDGKRFLMIKEDVAPEQSAARIVVVQNWFEELKRLVPIARQQGPAVPVQLGVKMRTSGLTSRSPRCIKPLGYLT